MNKAERQRRFAALKELGCICCLIDKQPTPCGAPEIHHLVDMGTRELSGGDESTIVLGRWHHQQIPLWGSTVSEMRRKYGPYLKSRRAFRERYGTERSLLAKVDAMIGEMEATT